MESFMSRVQEKIELNPVNTHKLVLKRKERITKGKTLDANTFKFGFGLITQEGNCCSTIMESEQGLKIIDELPIKKQKASRNLLSLQ